MNRFSKRNFDLSSKRRALLEALLQQEGIETSPVPRIARRPHSDLLPLSFAQQRLWFLDQWEPDSPVYNISRVFYLTGSLDPAALEQSLHEIVQRHEVLRTSFTMIDGKVVQVVSPFTGELLSVVDLTGLPQFEREVETQQLVREEVELPFDLAHGPLIRVQLMRQSTEEHILLLSIHHIVCDGWSLGILMGELSTLYQVYSTGQPSPLPALPLQYADYALWQRQWLQGETLQRQLVYWRQQLTGAPSMLALPTDRPRPSVQSFQGAHYVWDLPQELSEALARLSQREGVTLFMTVLAAFAVLLWRYSGQEDIVIGTPIANRQRPEIKDLIGSFVNTLALRLDLSGTSGFRELLGRVRETCLEAYANQDLPFEQLVETLAPERSLSHSPLFQVMFAFQNMPMESLQLPGVSVKPLAISDTGTARMDLMLSVVETPYGLQADFEYSTELFEAATIERLATHLQRLWESVVVNAQQRLEELPLLTVAERQCLLVDWNATESVSPGEVGLHQWFEAQVERTPEAIALIAQEEYLTYGELNRRATQLAAHLRQQGIGPEVLVGLCLSRSPTLLIALLAILKVGGAYVPLDPNYPSERLTYMLADAQVALLLTQSSCLERLSRHEVPALLLDRLDALDPSSSASCSSWELQAEQLAYVLYTSGSTGRPKGVGITHRSAAALLAWAQSCFPAHLLVGVLASTSICFDLSIFELFLPWSCGGTVVLAEDVLHLATAQAVTLVNTVPSAVSALLRAGSLPTTVRTVTLAGEALPATLVQQLYAQEGVQQVYNLYGPTEDTTYSTWAVLPSTCSEPVPIGRPIANTQAYVLDGAGQLVPQGVVGELYLAGAGLARGYLGQASLTAERFVPHAWSQQPGQRLYRTGDLVRWRGDGQLEFVGRADRQVKLRGYRIELGEIEAVLRQVSAVREAAVELREQRLVAYVVWQDEPLTLEQVREVLSGSLPDYMLPAAVVRMESLPLTPNGKLDRQALPTPDWTQLVLAAEETQPRTAVEEVLAGIWAQVLGRQRVGIHDNFFLLGGHSLLATQVVARLREVFQKEVSLRTFFETPTIAGLVRSLDQAEQDGSAWSAALLHPQPRPTELPLSFAQQRLWFLNQLEPAASAYNMLAALRLNGSLQVQILEQALGEIVRRHEILRTTFIMHGDHPVQHISSSLTLSLPIIDLSLLPLSQREELTGHLAREEARHPFDLRQGPLLRTHLLRLTPSEHLLLLNLHHIVCDGWSLDLLLRELATLYHACSTGQPSPLPDPPLHYADYALWQRQQLQAETVQHHLAYWQQQLVGAPALLTLPTDHPRPPVQAFRGAHHAFCLPHPLAQALRALSQREGVTLFMTVLAAFAVLLWRYSGQQDLLIGTPIANRPHRWLEGLIGNFANTLVLRIQLAGSLTFRDLLAQVRDLALEAYAHQDLPFERLVEALAPQRSLSYSPLFQVAFAFQNTSSPALELGEVELQRVDVENQTTKFDLALSIQDTERELTGSLAYSTDLFDEETMGRMIRHYEQVLEALAANPQQCVAAVPLLSEAERQRLLLDWNATAQPVPQATCVHHLFEVQAARTPDAVALLAQDHHLTYRELLQRARHLAEQLRQRGVGPEVLVGLCLPRGLDLVSSVLAVLQAGGAYLLLDPDAPSQRLAFMLHDSQAALLLTHSTQAARFSDLSCPVLCLDLPLSPQPQQGRRALELVQAEQLAYVIYTSGSTGQPKGTLLTHHGLLNLITWHLHAFTLSPLDRTTHLAGLSFDAATWELWPSLLCGGCLCLLDEATRLSPAHLQRWLLEQAITLSFLPTPLAEQVLSLNWSQPGCLRTLLVGGDVLHAVASRSLPFALVNNYGPTETTVVATSGLVVSELQGRPPAIGRPIANTQTYVLDGAGQLVPQGVVGELYLAGAGLARGYLGQASLTAERFVPHAWSQQPGQRLYRTGDLVRWRGDGQLEFVGRADRQVKLRGYRIELGEIEALLRQVPTVREAAVELREQRLVAYVVWQDEPLTAEQVREVLGGSLPDYMLPAAVVRMESLPLTPNGKLDRQALPTPDWTRLVRAAEEEAQPRTAVEEVVAGIWAQVLGRQRVGIHDDFFLLGGHSLLATQVVARLREVFRKGVSLRTFFETPTIAGLVRSLERADQDGSAWSAALPHPRPRPTELPLSFAQQRLWFLDQLEPNSPFYNVSASLHMTGSLHIEALEQSLNEIVRRHEILRTFFSMGDGHPIQIIAPNLSIPLIVVSLESLSALRQAEEVRRLAREEARRPFDLRQGPLLRTRLLRLAPSEHLLLLNLHHIVCDGWSLDLLLRELATLYHACSTGQPSPLPDLPLHYADYALWQRQQLQAETVQHHLTYWQQQLVGAPALLTLPTDHPRPPVQTFQGAHHAFCLPQPLAQALRALSQREGVTLFMTVLTAFAVLLWRYSGQQDLLIGTPIANRPHRWLEGLIGDFANTLVLRIQLAGSLTFRQLLAQVRDLALEAYAHQDLPFERLVEALAPQRSLSYSPLFQVMFALQHAPAAVPGLTGLTLSPGEVIDVGTARLDLILNMSERPNGLEGRFEYNTDLFEAATIERMAFHFLQLLDGIDPAQRLVDVPLLTEAERVQLLVDWNATRQTYSYEVCIHQLFEAQVLQTPDAIAIVYEEEQLTYRELNRRANHLAHYLQRQGVGLDVPVGICLPRSIDLIVGILAILKAGGAYVPLDPGYPSERLSFMLRDCHAPLLLTRESLSAALIDQQTFCLYLDHAAQAIAQTPDTNPLCQVCPQNLAYVIYTSGSTGQPKGVMVSHQAIANRLLWGQMACQLTPQDHMLHIASLSFDIAIWEIFGPWLVGARLILAQPIGYLDAIYLISLLREQQVTVAHFVPTVLHLLVEQEELATCRSLRWVLYGGEASSPELPRRLLARLDTHLQQFYGPTEAAINVTCWRCENEEDADQVSIGRPIANTQAYVLDGQSQPVPVGVVGELYLGGAGLARGYLRQPALTAERFVPNLWSQQPGERLYRTGDLARYLSDGSIQFVGRADTQVKLRGYRIELGEIEAILRQHPDVQEAVVLLREDLPGEKRLVAYVVAAGQPFTFAMSELRRYLQERLPDYMLPSALTLLEDFPLNANGKIDRRLLPAPEVLHQEAGLETSYLAPQTAMERTIAAIWQEILHQERIGVQDNFFDLGGHSLLIVRVQGRLREVLNRDIAIVNLFKYPTISSLADYLSKEQSDQPSSRRSDDRTEKLREGKNRLKQLLERTLRGTKGGRES